VAVGGGAPEKAIGFYWLMLTANAADRQAAVRYRFDCPAASRWIAFLQTKPDHIRVRPFPTGVYEGTGSTLVIYDPSRSARPAAF